MSKFQKIAFSFAVDNGNRHTSSMISCNNSTARDNRPDMIQNITDYQGERWEEGEMVNFESNLDMCHAANAAGHAQVTTTHTITL